MGGIQSKTTSTTTTVKKAKPTISEVDRAVLDLKNARDRLSKYQQKLEADEARLVERAKQAKRKGQTNVALQLLKIKKIKNAEVQNVSQQLLTVLQMVQTIDSKQNEAQVLQAMRVGKDALQKMHEETSVEDVLDLMDEIKEQAEVEREISGILQGVPELSLEDEAAVEAELEALMMEENGVVVDQLPEVPQTQPLPVAPTTPLPDVVAATTESEQPVAIAS